MPQRKSEELIATCLPLSDAGSFGSVSRVLSVVAVSDVPPIRAVFIMPCAHNFYQICEQKIRHQMTIGLSNGSGGRINGTAMIGGALLHRGIMNGTLVHGRVKDEQALGGHSQGYGIQCDASSAMSAYPFFASLPILCSRRC